MTLIQESESESESESNERCIKVGVNAFPQLQRKTSHLVLLKVNCGYRLY